MTTSVWARKYEPKTLDDVIFQDERQEQQFKKFVADADIPSLLLEGVQGTGKTSISKALLRDLNVDQMDRLKINASNEKIEALRNKVESFAYGMPVGKFRVVQLEEMDFLNHTAQGLLRDLIEDTSSNCRFIATCNYANKIMPAIKSRFIDFHFKAPDKDGVVMRMADILEAEKIDYDPEHLLTYVSIGYPDVRKTIQILQKNCLNGKLLSPKDETAQASDWKLSLLNLIETGNFVQARKVVCSQSTREEHEDIFTFLYQNLDKMNLKDKDAALLSIAEHAKAHSLVADTELNVAALFVSLGQLR